MRTIVKSKKTLWFLAIIMLALVTPIRIKAQDPQLLTPITSGGVTFERHLFSSGSISYCNVKYVDSEIKNYPPLDYFSSENFSIRIVSHDLFVTAVKESFTPERFALLVGRDEELYFSFFVSNTGKLIRIAFILKVDSQITLAELVALENNLVRRISFQPYNVNVTKPSSRPIDIFFNMSEVNAGEVKGVRFYSK